ncbi:DUF4127 family protein [Schleiferilactobacillus harbinensis]|jgi:hypothetical protein|uniref:DUF4127 family protein n=2 Tax=Schleiferilactobacillus harbinensis TaxID=304207 RepID=UPI001AAF5B6F|nr:DUF4127 family protein [Schleiferilactobacillus harbinensis]MBO3092592.1 DUF4127 family protein [Schleiferilactobacillus harbinensis]
MAQIMFLPLDERPCNYAYPLRIAQQMADIKMIAPPADMLSHKKTGLEFLVLESISIPKVLGPF